MKKLIFTSTFTILLKDFQSIGKKFQKQCIMKKFVLFTCVFLLSGFVSLAQQERISASSKEMKEKEAIMKVIEEETAAYYANDINRWAATFLQDSTNVFLNATKTGYNHISGWDNIFTNAHNTFNGQQADNREVKTPLVIRMNDGMAWVVYKDQVFNTQDQLVNEFIGTTILEKKDDSWKIVYRNTIWTDSYRQHDLFFINSINYAKSLGKPLEEFGQFTGEQFKAAWNRDNFSVNVLENWRSWTTADNFKILEQDEDHLIFTANNAFSNFKMYGQILNVSYDDQMTVIKALFEHLAEHTDNEYTQENTADGVRVSVAKKISTGK